MTIGELTDPTVTYKHCTDTDKSDMLDLLVERNQGVKQSSFGDQFCSSSKNCSMKINQTADVSDQGEKSFLEQTNIIFPIKNKTKAQNQTITNFQFEQLLKEETFTLTFDC